MKTKKNTTKNERILLVDGNNALIRAYFKFKGKGFSNGNIQTGAIYGFFKILYSNIVRFKITSVVVCFDAFKSKKRLEIYPEYKATRKKISEDWDQIFRVQFPIIRRILRNMGIVYVWDNKRINEAESDDYLALLYQKNCLSEVYLLSSDEDFVQLLNYPNLKIINPSKEEVITPKNCKSIYGYEVNQAVDMKILCGDSSDNISGMHGVGPVTALKFLEEYQSIDKYLKSKEVAKKFPKKELEELFKRNRTLIDLFYYLTQVSIEEIPYHSKKRIKNPVTLNLIFEKYQFKSFMAKEFLSVFKNLIPYKYE